MLHQWSEDKCVFFQNPEITFVFFCIFNLDYFRVLIVLKYRKSMYLVFEGKRRDIVLGFPWCVMCGGWFWIYIYIYIYIMTLKNEEVQNLIPIFFFTHRVRNVWWVALDFKKIPRYFIYI